jgi:cytochrome c556
MLRPPNNTGQDAWMKAAGDLRENAAQLGKTVANRDLAESRLALTRVAGACNNCHQSFRIETKVKVFEDAKP